MSIFNKATGIDDFYAIAQPSLPGLLLLVGEITEMEEYFSQQVMVRYETVLMDVRVGGCLSTQLYN